MKATIINWITPKGQTLNPHIPRNVKSGRGFHHARMGVLLRPAGYEWQNSEYISFPFYVKVLIYYLHRMKEKL
jgi:hypothetical protein